MTILTTTMSLAMDVHANETAELEIGDVVVLVGHQFVLLVPSRRRTERVLPSFPMQLRMIPTVPACAVANNQKIRFVGDNMLATLHDIRGKWFYAGVDATSDLDDNDLPGKLKLLQGGACFALV